MGLAVLLNQANILLIGAGNVALQKAQVLNENNIPFTTISNHFHNNIFKYLDKYKIKDFTISDITNFNYIINATGDKKITDQLLKEKQNRFFLLNIVNRPDLCDFYFQALLNFGKLQISVSSNGASPLISKLVKNKIKNIIPKEIEDILNEAYDKRQKGIIDKKQLKNNTKKVLSKAYIIGCGIKDVELLSIKAYKAINQLEVALVDTLLGDEIKKLIPKNCKIINIKKRETQDEINKIFYKHLKTGKIVGRLKNTNPYLYTKAEETTYLLKNNILNIEEIPKAL